MKNQIKYFQKLFYDLMNDYGRVFIIVKYSERSAIGNRGFTDEEKEKGIILVFNNENHKSLKWTEDGSIIAALSFGAGNRREDCFLYCDDIVALYSPDAMVRLERWDLRGIEDAMSEPERPEKFRNRKPPASKIVTLANFRKKPQ